MALFYFNMRNIQASVDYLFGHMCPDKKLPNLLLDGVVPLLTYTASNCLLTCLYEQMRKFFESIWAATYSTTTHAGTIEKHSPSTAC